jgi:hypothetical protein
MRSTCPSGDDPMTTGQVDEIQTISCTCGATCSGSIYVTFQGEVSAPIAWNAVATTAEENVHSLVTGSGRGESVQSKLEVRAPASPP